MFQRYVRTQSTFSFGTPSQVPIAGMEQAFGTTRNYDITRDGKQFIVVLLKTRAASRLVLKSMSSSIGWKKKLTVPLTGTVYAGTDPDYLNLDQATRP